MTSLQDYSVPPRQPTTPLHQRTPYNYAPHTYENPYPTATGESTIPRQPHITYYVSVSVGVGVLVCVYMGVFGCVYVGMCICWCVYVCVYVGVCVGVFGCGMWVYVCAYCCCGCCCGCLDTSLR